MHWTLLFIAAAFEIVWAAGLKFTAGFTRLWPSVGVGAAGTAVAGIFLFHESASPVRLACLTLIVVGVVGLKFFGK